jgi:hypothetical protein
MTHPEAVDKIPVGFETVFGQQFGNSSRAVLHVKDDVCPFFAV